MVIKVDSTNNMSVNNSLVRQNESSFKLPYFYEGDYLDDQNKLW